MTDLVVTGTDTGVGKTVIAAALLIALRRQGVKAVGFKPAETGLDESTPADSEVLAAASGIDEPLARPLLRLAEPLAPAVAADRAGLRLDPAAVEERVRDLRRAGYTVVVEGAGGLLAPLAWGFTALDLAEHLGLEAVIVAHAGLGTLNHVCLTVEALRRRGVEVRGVVLNRQAEYPGLAERTNPAALARLLSDLPIVVTPDQPGRRSIEAASAIAPFLATIVGMVRSRA